MAVFIMSASLCFLLLLGGFVCASSRSHGAAHPSSPVVSGVAAHVGFLRSKRANQLLRVEEILQGNLERECYEERCSYEEAREYFEDTEKTIKFWSVYVDGDDCESFPCLNGGNCTDKVGGFQCACPAPFQGPTCDLEAADQLHGGQPSAPQITVPEMFECPTAGPEACHQLCTASYRSFACSCTAGFKLQSDGRSCLPEVKFPCGHLSGESMCRHGNCPWQVSLLNSRGEELCSGVAIGRRSVLTAARCLVQDSPLDLRPSNFYVAPGNMKLVLPVQALHVHKRFRPDDNDNNLAFLELARPLPLGPALVHLCLPTKDFCENILMPPGRTGLTDHRDQDQDQDLAYMALDECRREVNVSHGLSNKMFCMSGRSRAPGNQQGEPTLTASSQWNETQRENQNGPRGGPKQAPGNRDHTSQKPSDASGNQTTAQAGPGGGWRAQAHGNSSQNQPQSGDSQRRGASGWRGGAGPRRGLLPGSPVATEEKGTSFLTGLLISTSSDGRRGLVFLKLSRFLGWIEPRLEASESVMTSQVPEFPESR